MSIISYWDGNEWEKKYSYNSSYIYQVILNKFSDDYILEPGEEVSITWKSNFVNSFRLEFSYDNGNTWNLIGDKISASLDSYTWEVPKIFSDNCYIRIISEEDSDIYDVSKIFSISPPPCPIAISDIADLGMANANNLETEIFEYCLNIENITQEDIKDISISCYSIINNVTQDIEFTLGESASLLYDKDNDGDIDLLKSENIIRAITIGSIKLPPILEEFTVGVSEIIVDGETYDISFEKSFSSYYITRPYSSGDSHISEGETTPYKIEVDSYGFESTDKWSWRTFINEISTNYGSSSIDELFSFFVSLSQTNGRCYRMASTSNLYFIDPESKPESVRNISTHNMKIDNEGVTEEIFKYHLRSPNAFIENPYYESMENLVNEAKLYISSNLPFILILGQDDKTGGHAVSVYKIIELIENKSPKEVYFCVYENNKHMADYAKVSLSENTFQYGVYNKAGIRYQEKFDNWSFYAYELKPYSNRFVANLWEEGKVFICVIGDYFSGDVGKAAQSGFTQKIATNMSLVKMLITDPTTGNRVGFVNGTELVNEIIEAEIEEFQNGEEVIDYAFYVPHGPPYNITFFTQNAGNVDINIVSPRSETEARNVNFEDVEVESETLAYLDDINIYDEQPPVLEVDIDGDGDIDNQISASINAEIVVGVYETRPSEFWIYPPYPNPFNTMTKIEYQIPVDSHVKLVIYDILGRRIAVLENNIVNSGNHEVIWNGITDKGELVSSGVYIYSIIADKYHNQGKMLLLK